MKDTKTVLPTINAGGPGENKNGFHHKHKIQENGTDDSTTTTTLRNGLDSEELVGGCCVCSDDQGFANNALVYCDGKDCTVACHTACYGIVSIPDGNWYCGRCEAGDIRAPCRLCPTVEGAMKRTSDGGWAHVVCALYIPEVSFGDDTTMQPIILSKIPSTRFGQECSICTQNGRSKLISTSGACCACTVKNCSQVFHVTCAQANGLLCEDVRKNNCQYPIYCEQHRPKLSKFIRQITAFQYSPNAIASNEQLKKQSRLKEKESPSQLSDFVAAAAAEAEASETNIPSSTSILNDTNNQTNTSDEQQTPVPRTAHSIDALQRKSSSNTNSSLSSSSSAASPIVQQKTHSRSSSSSSTNSSLQKKVKLNDEMNNNNRSLNDLSQFVQLNKEERSFLPPPPPPPSLSSNQSDAKEATIMTTKSDSSTIDSKETKPDNSKSSKTNVDSQSSLNSIEEKSLASRCTISSSSSNNNNTNKSPIKQRLSTDGSLSTTKSTSLKKPSLTKTKDEDDDDDDDGDYEMNKKRKLSIKLNKDGQPRKKRQHSVEGGSRPVGRPPSKKTVLAQQLTNGVKRPISKSSTSTIAHNNNNNNMKQQKVNDTQINIQRRSSENKNDTETKITSRSTHYYPCDHFGNQINSDVFKQQAHSDDQIDKNEESSRQRVSSSSTTTTTTTMPHIDFYPRRPLQAALAQSTTTEQQQRTFPPQTLEEFLEQEWESSSDFLLQQTMPHDVSSLLTCLYQFKSENAALQKKFDELKHRRDSLRVTNANLRRRLSDILPVTETIPPPPTTATTTVTQVSPPPPVPAPASLPPPPAPIVSTVLPVIPPSPRKEQQQLKQQKLLAELELQQQLQQQKAISPTRRRLSTNTLNQHTDSSPSTTKKNKSPRHSNALTHQSILENQLRQSANNTNMNSTKKSSTPTVPSTKKLPSSEMELVTHLPSTSTTSSVLPTVVPSTSTYEPTDVAATAAAAYTLAKNGRTPASAGLSLELLSHILAASGTGISPQLFAPTWNISNFGYANFPGANPMSVSEESILRSYAPPPPTHPSLEQQPQSQTQSSTKPQP
ncbi:hypothetical protein I4U23_028508 [Adineta vaga]|nr:hypothetical protein I4U23_028508 [Adineta vaga]